MAARTLLLLILALTAAAPLLAPPADAGTVRVGACVHNGVCFCWGVSDPALPDAGQCQLVP
jgi:hypothetical protein